MDLLEIVYNTIAIASCLFLYLQTQKLYSLSSHPGIRSLKNAFLYLGLGFIARYLLMSAFPFRLGTVPAFGAMLILEAIMYYLFSISGLSLCESLVWKSRESRRVYLIHLLAVLIGLLSVYQGYVLYVSQIAVLAYASTIAYSNHKQQGKRFQQLYFIALILGIIGYLVNLVNYLLAPMYQQFTIYAYAATTVTFIIFIYGVVKASWQRNGSV